MNTSITTESLPDGKENIAAFRSVAGLGLFFALLGALFFERIQAIAFVWYNDGNYSHGFLIVPICAWLTYRVFQSLETPLQAECTLGACTMALGVMILLGNPLIRVMTILAGLELNLNAEIVDFVAVALLLRGAAVVIGGRAWAASYTFPILFLFFMFPLPVTWTNFASVWLQDWVSWISGRVLELFFVSHQQGNMILLAGAEKPIFIAQECSGLRQMVAFLALATLVGYLSNNGVISFLLMLAAAVPIAILSNVLRVLLMAMLIRYAGAESVSGWLHDVPALVTLPFGLLFFFVLQMFIGNLFAAKSANAPEVS